MTLFDFHSRKKTLVIKMVVSREHNPNFPLILIVKLSLSVRLGILTENFESQMLDQILFSFCRRLTEFGVCCIQLIIAASLE